MNTPKNPTEKPVAKTKTDKPKAAAVAETKPKTEKPAKAAATVAKPKKASPAAKSPKQAKAEAPKAEAAATMPVSERVGLTAGSIWNYLSQNGATPVAKLVKELTEEEKIVQRSIGWLAQEGKITLNVHEQIETIELK